MGRYEIDCLNIVLIDPINTGFVAQWITRLPTEQKIPGSTPGRLDFFFLSKLSLLLDRKIKTILMHTVQFNFFFQN